MSYFVYFVIYFYVNLSGLINSVGGESLVFCYLFLAVMWFLFGRVPLPLGACDILCYLIVVLLGPCVFNKHSFSRHSKS